MTWEQIKLAALQKMFASDGTDISNPDEATKEYLNAMPQAANEAIEMICTAGRYLRKSYTVDKDKGEKLTVNLAYEVPDYWRMGAKEVYKLVDDTPEPVDGVELYGGKYLVFPADFEGEFEFFYDAKPATLTLETPEKSTCRTMPLYCCRCTLPASYTRMMTLPLPLTTATSLRQHLND